MGVDYNRLSNKFQGLSQKRTSVELTKVVKHISV